MTLPTSPPYYGLPGSAAAWQAMEAPIKLGEIGWRAFAVQSVVGVTADGYWGPMTDRAVTQWQAANNLTADGIFGPMSQGKALDIVAAAIDVRYHVIPDGAISGFVRVEGADLLAATNWYTPEGSKVGVDCGPAQIRVYRNSDFTYSTVEMADAFNLHHALRYVAKSVTARIKLYQSQAPQLAKHRVIEAAVLAHNWPVGAAQVVRNGGSVSNPDKLALWTSIPMAERINYGGRTQYTEGEWSYEYPKRVLAGVNY